MAASERLDAIVIGAGVVGLAVGRALAQRGLETIVVERHRSIGEECSSRNSGVIHAGIYYPPGSLKARLCVHGKALLYEYCAARGIAHSRCGKLLIAGEAQLPTLRNLHAKAVANGVGDLAWLNPGEVGDLEPEVRCAAALHSPSTGILDPHELMTALLGDLEAAGGALVLDSAVERLRPVSGGLEVEIDGGGEKSAILARRVVNATGLSAVALSRCIEGYPANRIPKAWFAKGNYFSCSGRPFRRLVYPMPTEASLGIHATPDLAGSVRFGPDVEWVEHINYDVDPARAEHFRSAIREYWPGVMDRELQPAYAGIRPKIVGTGEPAADFMIAGPADHGIAGLYNLIGIESPGLTASLAIGEYLSGLLEAGVPQHEDNVLVHD